MTAARHRRLLASAVVELRRAHGGALRAAEYLASCAVQYERTARAARRAGVTVPRPASWFLR